MSFHTPAKGLSNGTGTEREIVRHVIKMSQEEANLSTPTRVTIAREGLVCNNENNNPNAASFLATTIKTKTRPRGGNF